MEKNLHKKKRSRCGGCEHGEGSDDAWAREACGSKQLNKLIDLITCLASTLREYGEAHD
jgi:hypothetical protein